MHHRKFAEVTGKFFALFQKHSLDFLANLYTKKLHAFFLFSTMPAALTNRWHIDITVTHFENLERICFGKNMSVTWSTPSTDGFLTCFRKHIVPSTWRGKATSTESFSHCLLGRKKNQNRKSLVPSDCLSHFQWNYAMFPICGYTDFYLQLFQ